MAQTQTLTPSPKARFLSLKSCVDQHMDLLSRPDLQLSLEQALLQYNWEVCGGGNMVDINGNSAAASFYKILGAHEFLRIFKTLAQPPAPAKSQVSQQEISHTF